MKETCENRPVEIKVNQKKAYARPELIKHGNVEAVTQLLTGPGTSQPVG